jgi:hypothetical protein
VTLCDQALAELAACYERAADKARPSKENACWRAANALWMAAREYGCRRTSAQAALATIDGGEHSTRLAAIALDYDLDASALLLLKQATDVYGRTRPEAGGGELRDTTFWRDVGARAASHERVVDSSEAPHSEEARARARARVREALPALPRAEDRRGAVSDLLGVTAPDLRASSGRLDARKIADRLGIALGRLAGALPVSRQALSALPDSLRAQEALDPIARALHVLDLLLPRERVRMWLNAPHPRLEGSTPVEALLDGRAERVAQLLEIARAGGVD